MTGRTSAGLGVTQPVDKLDPGMLRVGSIIICIYSRPLKHWCHWNCSFLNMLYVSNGVSILGFRAAEIAQSVY